MNTIFGFIFETIYWQLEHYSWHLCTKKFAKWLSLVAIQKSTVFLKCSVTFWHNWDSISLVTRIISSLTSGMYFRLSFRISPKKSQTGSNYIALMVNCFCRKSIKSIVVDSKIWSLIVHKAIFINFTRHTFRKWKWPDVCHR